MGFQQRLDFVILFCFACLGQRRCLRMPRLRTTCSSTRKGAARHVWSEFGPRARTEGLRHARPLDLSSPGVQRVGDPMMYSECAAGGPAERRILKTSFFFSFFGCR